MSNKVFYTGKVIWFNPKFGYGFIEWFKGTVKQKDMFVHFSDITIEGFKTLTRDQAVKFTLGTNKRLFKPLFFFFNKFKKDFMPCFYFSVFVFIIRIYCLTK